MEKEKKRAREKKEEIENEILELFLRTKVTKINISSVFFKSKITLTNWIKSFY